MHGEDFALGPISMVTVSSLFLLYVREEVHGIPMS